ncbi:hypothetical protein HPB50_002816 [Hyalomma asiaticum]|uniref:Uncharacterized protein n=1 Tax=Hyalomma asiaticum TaxID=266040 RepID=A0ACB7SDD4_HYAAI|nr:hypothetical protein HPB50_002816 [Hyalomma asiaticum]
MAGLNHAVAMPKELQDRRDIVVDRCWSLAPLSAMSALLAMLISKNSALFYVAFIDEFGVSHQSASWPLTLNVVMAHVAGTFRIGGGVWRGKRVSVESEDIPCECLCDH